MEFHSGNWSLACDSSIAFRYARVIRFRVQCVVLYMCSHKVQVNPRLDQINSFGADQLIFVADELLTWTR